MARRPINPVGGYYTDPNRHWTAQDCLNLVPVRAERAGSRTGEQFRDGPGHRPFVHITRWVDGERVDAGPVRGIRNVEGKLFVVAGTALYQVTAEGVAIPYGNIPGIGRVSMAHNQRGNANELLIVNGSSGYVFNTGTLVLRKITDSGYPGAFIADFVDHYLAQVEPQGRYWFHSDIDNALSYNTLDEYEAEGDPDRIVSLIVSHREVLVFGNDTIEPFVNTGAATGTFERASNTVIECGCAAKYTPRKLDNSVLWLDDKRIIRRLDGYTPVRVSVVGVESALAECTREEISAAYAFTFEDSGHKIYFLTVPGRFTFGYDVLTGEIHRHASNGLPHWAVTDVAFWNGQWIAGDSRNGKLYVLDWNYMLDGAEPLERERVTGFLADNQDPITINEVELLFGPGGPETIPVDFPLQPVGPTISGDPTAGQKCEDYSFTFTATGDGPLRFTLRSGTLPSGMRLTPTGELTATRITSSGEYTITVRVTDRHGLYADLTVTIGIAAVSWDYVTWLGPHAQVFTTPGPPAVLEPDTIIVPVPDFSGVGGRYRSTDGVTFTNLGAGWYQAAAVNPETGRLVFARTPAVMEWSDDAGTTVTTASGDAVSVERLVFQKDGFYAVGGGRYAFGGAEGETWVNGPADPDASVFFAWSELLEKWVRLSAGPPSLVQTSDDLLNGPWTSVATIPTSGLNQLGGFNIVRDVFYASTQGGQIWRSTDAVNWTLVHTLTGTIKGDISLLPDVGPTGSLVSYGGGAAKISVSQDNGLTWTDYNAPFSGGYGVYVEGTHTYVNVRHMATSVADIIDSCEVEP